MKSQKMTPWKNTFRAALKPITAKVMMGKLIKRVTSRKGTLDKRANLQWLQDNATDLSHFLDKFPSDIKEETSHFLSHIKKHSSDILDNIPYDLGGGGGVPLLYALVRHLKPDIVVETGVAAGFSSSTILTAMKQNDKGHLFSSDFPYFRLPNPEQYVGVVVEDGLKDRWSLHLKGDEYNLPEIMKSLTGKIALFHYDSDKSYDGRAFAMDAVRPHLTPDAVLVIDDIQDNSYFHDYVAASPSVPWTVFLYEGKYIGLIGRVF